MTDVQTIWEWGCFQARREEVQQQMERQFKQGMAAPDWELEDYEWCEPSLWHCINDVGNPTGIA